METSSGAYARTLAALSWSRLRSPSPFSCASISCSGSAPNARTRRRCIAVESDARPLSTFDKATLLTPIRRAASVTDIPDGITCFLMCSPTPIGFAVL